MPSLWRPWVGDYELLCSAEPDLGFNKSFAPAVSTFLPLHQGSVETTRLRKRGSGRVKSWAGIWSTSPLSSGTEPDPADRLTGFFRLNSRGRLRFFLDDGDGVLRRSTDSLLAHAKISKPLRNIETGVSGELDVYYIDNLDLDGSIDSAVVISLLHPSVSDPLSAEMSATSGRSVFGDA